MYFGQGCMRHTSTISRETSYCILHQSYLILQTLLHGLMYSPTNGRTLMLAHECNIETCTAVYMHGFVAWMLLTRTFA